MYVYIYIYMGINVYVHVKEDEILKNRFVQGRLQF